MQNILTAGNATSNLSTAAGDDGAFKIVVGPNGSQVDGLAIGATGNAAVAGTLTQAGVATPRMVLSTAQNTTSGTAIDFTGIPSWVKRITIGFNGVSTNGTSVIQVQIGSGSVDTTGYASSAFSANGTASSPSTITATSGFVTSYDNGATVVKSGIATLMHLGGNVWTFSVVLGRTDSAGVTYGGGTKTLSGSIDRIRLTTVNGTDTFDAGSVNILYEG